MSGDGSACGGGRMNAVQKTDQRYVAVCESCGGHRVGPERDSFYQASDDVISHQHHTIPDAAQPNHESDHEAETHSVRVVILQEAIS